MTRAQRPKRSATPTSATFPPPAAPPAPAVAPPPPRKPLYLCSPFVEAALVKGNFKTIVMLPKYVDIMEWVAVNSALISRPIDRLIYLVFCKVFDFYTNLNEFYGVVAECCTQKKCPAMSAGPAYVPLTICYVLSWLTFLI